MSKWPAVTLEGICDSIQYGVTASASDEADGPNLLRITDIVPPLIDWDSVPKCTLSEGRIAKYELKPHDIVVARTGATVGYAKFLRSPRPGSVFASYLVRFQIGQNVDPGFVGQIVQSADYKDFVSSNAGGAAQPNANARILGSYRFALPNLKTQRRIAAVLGSFDELIEINERRIVLLSDAIRSIYRTWFLKLRFPGHQRTELVDSKLGQIPSGWTVQPAGETFDVVGGGTPSKKKPEYWTDGHIPWFTPSDLTGSRRRFAQEPKARITNAGLSKSAARLFPAGAVMMTSRATLGVLGIATAESACNQGFIVIPPGHGMSPQYVYEWLHSQAGYLEKIATGATFKEITKGAFKKVPVLVPSPEVLARFDEAVEPLGQLILLFERAIQRLAQTRDLLLPRLVTGQLDISDIDLGVLTPPEPE